MRFKVKNDFFYKGKLKRKGTTVNVANNLINDLRKANVIEEPIKELGIEKAVMKSKEKQIIK